MATKDPVKVLMIEHLLVPLDGSRLAEATLPAAISLGERLRARVTLLHVLERRAPTTIHGERHLAVASEAEAYLNGVASRFADAGVPVDTHVHPNPEGDVGASIAAHAAELGADLIVLCTHGEGGMRGWLSGSLAQHVVRRVNAPVLLVRPDGTSRAPFAPRETLVALDGTQEGEAALPAAATLAQAWSTPLRLICVVPTLGTVGGDRGAVARMKPSATSAVLDLEQSAAAAYLAGLVHRAGATGIPTEMEVVRGDPAGTVAALAARADRTLLAIATHGRSGLDALWSGSVGAKVVGRVTGPLLLVRS